MKLSIIIANRNDLVVFNITLNSLIEALKRLDCESEIVVIDNSDPHIWKLMDVVCPHGFKKRYGVRMFHTDTLGFTAARQMAAEKARGEYIFCIDSHVLIGNRTLQDSVDFMESNKDKEDLGFGHPPIRWAHQGPAAIRYQLGYADNGTPWGNWAGAITETKKIFWKFMPWICRRDWYLNTLKGYGTHATYAMSWGGAELLQQIKSWMLGYEQWGIVTDPIIHIGPYTPDIVKTGQYKYRTYAKSGFGPHGLGVLTAFYVLGGKDGYKHALKCDERIQNRHKISVHSHWKQAMEIGKEEHEWLDKNKKYGYIELLETKPWED